MNATREALRQFVHAAGDLLAAMHAIAADAQDEGDARQVPAGARYDDIAEAARSAISKFNEAVAPCFTQKGEAPDVLLKPEAPAAKTDLLELTLQGVVDSNRRARDLIERAIPDDEEAALDALRSLRLADEMVRALRRLLPGRTVEEIHRAFGAPGDFGYETPIGDALARLYGLRGAR